MELLHPGPRARHWHPASITVSATHRQPLLPAVPGMAEHLVLLICNLSLCTWMTSGRDQERMHLRSSGPPGVLCPNSLLLPLQRGWTFSIPRRTPPLGFRGRALLQVQKEKHAGTLILGMCLCGGRLPCPGTIPRDAEHRDHVIKHPSHAIPFSLHFFHLSGAVGAGSHIPMVMGGQVTASRFDAKCRSRWLMGRTTCPSSHHPP